MEVSHPGHDDELLLNTNYGAGDALRAESFTASAEVGRRLPHVPLTTDGSPSSTLDLIDGRFTLLTHHPSANWEAATEALTGEYPGLRYVSVTTPARVEVKSGSWVRATNLEPKAALLIRPDGHIAARLHGTDPLQEAREAMGAAYVRAPTGSLAASSPPESSSAVKSTTDSSPRSMKPVTLPRR